MVFSWMRNEADLVPFFLRHYWFADKLIVWDNESTDSTREKLAADKRVEIREWVTGGVMKDWELARMKSEEYRKTGLGWKIIVDADEFLWHPQFRLMLDWYDSNGVTVPITAGFDMVSESFPEDDGKSQLTDLVKEGVRNPLFDKLCLVRGEQVRIEYWAGAHKAQKLEGKVMAAMGDNLMLLHYRYLGLERTVRKAREYRPSLENVQGRMGMENCNVAFQTDRYRQRLAQRKKII